MYKGRAPYRKETRHGQASEPSPGSEPTQAARSGPRRHSAAALQHPDRAGIRRLDPAVHPVPQAVLPSVHRVPRKQHPEERGAVAGEAFLTALAVNSNVASSTRNHAPNAIVFLYRQILRKGFGLAEGVERAKKPAGRPVVFTRDEERAVLARWTGPMRDGEPLVRLRVAAHGIRRLRVRDVDSDQTPLQRVRFRLQAPL